MLDGRQLEAADRDRQYYQRNAQTHVRRLDRRRFMQAVSLQDVGRHRSDVIHRLRGRTQNQQSPEKRRQKRSQRVERLRQIQPARSRLGFPQHRDIRIRRHLQASNPSRQHDEGTQEQWIRRNAGSRHKQKSAQPHGEQTHHHRPLVANPVDDLGRGNGEKEISSKERKLNQHDLRIAQVKNRFQVRNQNVIQAGKKSPHEEKRGHRSQRSAVALPRAGRRGGSSSRSIGGRDRHECCSPPFKECANQRTRHHSIARARLLRIFLRARSD